MNIIGGTVVLGAVLVLASGCAATPSDSARSASSTAADPAPPKATDFTDFDCNDLAKDAVLVSSQMGGDDAKLLKVRGATIYKDHRSSVAKPKGEGESLILACDGMGVWSNDSQSPVRLKWTLDSDGEAFVAYEPL